MHRPGLASLALIASLLVPFGASADRLPEPASAGPTAGTPADPDADPGEPRLITRTGDAGKPAKPAAVIRGAAGDHDGQVGIAMRLSTGLRTIAPYDGKVYCGTTSTDTSTGNAPVCLGRTPTALDLDLAYGIKPRLEAMLEFRIGLEGDFAATPSAASGPHLLHLAPGLRFFYSDAGKSKLFTTAQAVIDLTGYQDAAGVGRGADFGLRNLNGLWIDLERRYGVYVFVGETLTFARWLSFGLEAGIGVQGRYP
jgi:hypothetical protein